VRSPEYRANQQRYRQYQAVRRNPEKMRRMVGLTEEPRPLRVVAVVHYYPPAHRAGAELMLHALLRALAERGHQVEVWATDEETDAEDRKSTRLNSSHVKNSYAVFCLKKKTEPKK